MKPPSHFHWDCTEKISGRKPGMKMKRRLAGSSLALINTRREFLCRRHHWANCYSNGLGCVCLCVGGGGGGWSGGGDACEFCRRS